MKDKNKKLDSIKKNTSKLNYFLKNVQVSSKKAKVEIPEVIKVKTDASVEIPSEKATEPKIINKADYHYSSFKKTLNDIRSKVNSLLMKRDNSNTLHKNVQWKSSENKTTPIYENMNKESFLPVKDKLRTITNNTKKTIIRSKEKTIPEKTVINNENIKVVPEKTVINNENIKEKTIPEKTVINNENIKVVERPSKNNENVITQNVKTKIIPHQIENNQSTNHKIENNQSTNHKIENSISNTLNRIDKINKNTNSSIKLHGIVNNSKSIIKNVLKKSVLLHNQMNKNSISNTNYENVSKIVNSKNIKSITPNISTVLTKEIQIPSLAEGGYVEKPTVAQIGDAKTPSGKKEGEMVIAPSKLPEILAETNVIEKAQKKSTEKAGAIKNSPTKGLSEMANESLMVNADRKTTQQANTASNTQETPSAPLIINQAGQSIQSAPPTSSPGGQKLGLNDMMNVSLPRWRSRMG